MQDFHEWQDDDQEPLYWLNSKMNKWLWFALVLFIGGIALGVIAYFNA